MKDGSNANKFGEFIGYSIVALILIALTTTVLAYAFYVYKWMIGG